MAGRRPKPTSLKKLGGNPGKRALNERELTPKVEAPEMPPGLSAIARKEWVSIVPVLLLLGVLSRIDGKALAAYCHAYARWHEAELRVREFGIVIEEPVLWRNPAGKPEVIGYRHKKNPACNISESALKTMKSFLIEFGMTPASRARLNVEKPGDNDEDSFDKFLKRNSKQNDGKLVN